MKLTNVHGFADIDTYVSYKLALYTEREKNFNTLFELMFDESDNVMLETTDGYRIRKTTYGEFKTRILKTAPTVARAFSEIAPGEIIGLYMQNSPEWLLAFWSLIVSGYRVLLMNTRLADETLDSILKEHAVKGVLSDGKRFPSATTLLASDVLTESDGALPERPFGSEVLFMSSGTSNHVKLSAYNGENFYYQVLDSVSIIKACPDIKKHYKGELKQLVLLPLCHVFGFIAVYLWFGFFSRTFVFPRDLDPATIQRTVKKHEVTHIFAVPMVFEAVTKAALSKIRSRGEKTYKRFQKVSAYVNRAKFSGDFVAKKLLSEVREGLFGDSVLFLISGGAAVSEKALKFFNGIGYHLANGYGMTEIGITSVETSSNKSILNSGSIGAPFDNTEYRLDENGYLFVRGKARAFRIIEDGVEKTFSPDEWFKTGDLLRYDKGRYYCDGRADDLMIGADGENLNPTIAESLLSTEGVDKLSLFSTDEGKIALVASIPGIYAKSTIDSLHKALLEKLEAASLTRTVTRVLFTNEGLLGKGEFKLSRKKLAARIKSGELSTFDPDDVKARSEEFFSALEDSIRKAFAEALGKNPEEIGKNAHFFRELGGTSMDYFVLLGLLREKLGVTVSESDTATLASVSDFSAYLQK